MNRPAQFSDFHFIYHLYMHPEINPFLLYEPMEKSAFEPIFQQLLDDKVLYVFEDNHIPIGMFKLIPLKHRTAHIAYLGGVAIDPRFAGQGFARKMFAEILALGRTRNLKRIELSVSVENARAIALYEKCGFQQEGVLRQYTHLQSENRYLDEALMAYLY
ncbi:GNAT family N-acetyltransferase [Undibacterium baiyunense]|uniref:GNAT family N-acetyltransferase n=1 Tax=Undibacterium baiyunense TaxID=2828731 RepID=A0A941DCD7_9BURK|nr:GNAT family protein [Undibacterium baiyunense]MBR7746143.1 GNAT family N-acetyltransferase [Undibacterium baiyunense]